MSYYITYIQTKDIINYKCIKTLKKCIFDECNDFYIGETMHSHTNIKTIMTSLSPLRATFRCHESSVEITTVVGTH